MTAPLFMRDFVESWLTGPQSPTSDLYFAWLWNARLASGEIERFSPTVFRWGRTVIVVRHLSGLGRLPEHERLVYVIDDNWRAGVRDRGIPIDYRLKLAAVEASVAPELEKGADAIVVGSEWLASRYRELLPGKRVIALDPFWIPATSGLPRRYPHRLAVLASRSHASDFRFLVPVLRELLARYGHLEITISGNLPVPRDLQSHDAISVVPPLSWSDYLEWGRHRSFDIALHPVLPGPFNDARSVNKLLEYDQFGAGIVCSRNWRAASTAAEAGNVRAVTNDQQAWLDAICDLIETPGAARQLAEANRSATDISVALERGRAAWYPLLDIEGEAETSMAAVGTA